MKRITRKSFAYLKSKVKAYHSNGNMFKTDVSVLIYGTIWKMSVI